MSGVYNLKIPADARKSLEKKAKKRGMDLADYLRQLMAVGEAIEENTDASSVIRIERSPKHPESDLVIPASLVFKNGTR